VLAETTLAMTLISPIVIETNCTHGASRPCDDKLAGVGNDAMSLPTPTRALASSDSQHVMKLRNKVAHSRVASTSWHFRPSVGSWLANASRGKAAACATVSAAQHKGVAASPAVNSIAPPAAIQSIAPPVHSVAPAAAVALWQADRAHDQCASQNVVFAPSPRSFAPSPRSTSEACAGEEAEDMKARQETSPLAGASKIALAEDDAMLRSCPMQGSRPTAAEEDCPAPGGPAPVGIAPVGVAPVGVAPVGIAPVGIAPVGIAPVGIAPVGIAPGGIAPVGIAPVGN